MALSGSFSERHMGSSLLEQSELLQALGVSSLEKLIDQTIPASIRLKKPLQLSAPRSERDAIRDLEKLMDQNELYRSFIGMGYVGTVTPPVIQRNILENPGWYTQYTPYQAEIAQGRLEALLNFQTLVMDFTGMEIANASLLDEGTAAAEAMALAYSLAGRDASKKFWVAKDCHPQTIAVVETRAKYLGVEIIHGDPTDAAQLPAVFGALLQYPNTYGEVFDYSRLIQNFHDQKAIVTLACDLFSLAVLKSPGELGADIAVGNSQCFGVPMGFGGPHAGFFATKDAYKRNMPGRIVGVSKDADGNPAIRLALQTREQHIRRDKATSNICTAQVLLAIMASMYAVYHGPKRIRNIAEGISKNTAHLRDQIKKLGIRVLTQNTFNTLLVEMRGNSGTVLKAELEKRKINLRWIKSDQVGITLDETTDTADLQDLLDAFAASEGKSAPQIAGQKSAELPFHANFARKSKYLTHPVFNSYHSETEMLRYITRLQSKDLSLAHSMIPLGSCTMKLNATTEMLPVTWAKVGSLHPFVPNEQVRGYRQFFKELESDLCEITGFDGVSLQPNAGSQGEYAGLLAIRRYFESRKENHRDICLIPQSAHGTNPASASMAGLKVVVVATDRNGNVDVADLKAKAAEHSKNLAALMVTYPSTHGVFEEAIHEICEIIHANGGQVYMDGANMNAQVGLCRPGDFGADVCHLNLHKTFCIPHGGGGPGMGPIGVRKHLVPFLPGHPVTQDVGGSESFGTISAAAYGSASILPISYLYIKMMGEEGLRQATENAILNANYISTKLAPHYPVLYQGANGRIAHECILDLRPLKEKTGIEVEDLAKRLMDYGFHAPTISFPVPGTLMIEPTESESKAELDRFIEAMVGIREEIREIEEGKAPKDKNVLKNAPHTATRATASEWPYSYTREKAVYPLAWVKERKFWPSVSRIDNVYGERNLVCSCLPIEAYQS